MLMSCSLILLHPENKPLEFTEVPGAQQGPGFMGHVFPALVPCGTKCFPKNPNRTRRTRNQTSRSPLMKEPHVRPQSSPVRLNQRLCPSPGPPPPFCPGGCLLGCSQRYLKLCQTPDCCRFRPEWWWTPVNNMRVTHHRWSESTLTVNKDSHIENPTKRHNIQLFTTQIRTFHVGSTVERIKSYLLQIQREMQWTKEACH